MPISWPEIDAVICDMDGVLWLDETPIAGLPELFALFARGLPYALATNNSSKTPADYVAKLARLGVAEPVSADNIITSGTATTALMRQRYPAGTPVHVVGGAGLRHLLAEAGFTLVERDARAVVVGLDTALTYDKLKAAAFCLRAGADFIATNDDAALPTPEGLAPGAGSIAAALATAAAVAPLVVGKPHRPMFDLALRLLGSRPERTVMIGDRMETDIIGAAKLGIKTALVLSGVTTLAMLAEAPTQPDAIYADLAELTADWRATRGL